MPGGPWEVMEPGEPKVPGEPWGGRGGEEPKVPWEVMEPGELGGCGRPQPVTGRRRGGEDHQL